MTANYDLRVAKSLFGEQARRSTEKEKVIISIKRDSGALKHRHRFTIRSTWSWKQSIVARSIGARGNPRGRPWLTKVCGHQASSDYGTNSTYSHIRLVLNMSGVKYHSAKHEYLNIWWQGICGN